MRVERENEGKGGHASMQVPIMLCFKSTQLFQATLTFVVEWIVYKKFSFNMEVKKGQLKALEALE